MRSARRLLSACALLACQPLLAGTNDAASSPASDPAMLIEAMSGAMQTLNYEGTFVKIQNGVVESMHILHAHDGDGELERMLSLTGEAREVVRTRSAVTCIWPDSDSVVVSDSKPRKVLPRIDKSLSQSSHYDITLGDPDRVAGIVTDVVSITPRDEYRYGYRFWIDRDTRMLLRSEMLDRNELPVEQFIFTTINYPESIDIARFELPLGEQRVSRRVAKPAGTPGDDVHKVSFRALPAGYAEISQRARQMPINDAPVTHVMVSDGMASVSVYVEHLPSAQQDVSLIGLSSMGAMNAFSRSLPDALVTVVGEVPGETVQTIAEAVTLQ